MYSLKIGTDALWAVLAGSVLLAACASGPPVAQLSDERLCHNATTGAWVGKDTEQRDELLKRGLIQPQEWSVMKAKRFMIGMSECAALSVAHWTFGRYEAVGGEYQIGLDSQLIVYAPDPRKPSATLVDSVNERASRIYFGDGSYITTPYKRTQQSYVPKYMLHFHEGELTGCWSVDISKVDTTASVTELFPRPCQEKEVHGFN